MSGLSSLLTGLVTFGGTMAVIVAALVIYGNVLSTREESEIYINKTEEAVMASDQAALVGRMHLLSRVIAVVGALAGVSLLAGAALWVYVNLYLS